jgi:replicative DNA helicase
MSGSKDNLVERLKGGAISPDQAVQEFAKSRSNVKFRPMDVAELEQQYDKEKRIREEAEANAIPFISRDFHPDFLLSQGLILVGARPGQSKSTTAANIVAGYLKASTKKALVISNEDSSETVYTRVACVLLEKSFTAYRNKRLSKSDEEKIRLQAKGLMNRLVVIASSAKYNMTRLEDVVAVLEYAETESEIGLVLLDYYQTVTLSEENLESFQVLKRLGSFLMEYGRRVPKPVIVMAQLKRDAGDTDAIEDRFQNDKTIFCHAYTAVEIRPDFATGLTTFIIHKERFGAVAQKTEVVMRYENGRYVADSL